jgi:hypothetical protein
VSDTQPARYFSTWGPMDGPIRYKDNPPCMGIMATPAAGLPIGIAYSGRYRQDPRGSVALFRLVVYKQEVPGLWEC